MFVPPPRGVPPPDVVLKVLPMYQCLFAAEKVAVEKIVFRVSFVVFISNHQGRCSMILVCMDYELGC